MKCGCNRPNRLNPQGNFEKFTAFYDIAAKIMLCVCCKLPDKLILDRGICEDEWQHKT